MADVNDYLQQITQLNCTAKDFPTWAQTLMAAIKLNELGKFNFEKEALKNIVLANKNAAKQLENRLATCNEYDLYPAIIEVYFDSKLLSIIPEIYSLESISGKI